MLFFILLFALLNSLVAGAADYGISASYITLIPQSGLPAVCNNGDIRYDSVSGFVKVCTSNLWNSVTTNGLNNFTLASANGFAGNVVTAANASTLTLSTTVGSGLIKSNGTGGLVNAVSGVDYLAGGSALLVSNNLSDLNSVSTARTNLGLGTFALKNNLVSADIPNNAANTSGNAATATALATSPTQCATGFHAMGITVLGNASCVSDTAAAFPINTKGDLLGYSTSPVRVPVGSDGQLLQADSTQSTGLKWVAAPVSGINQLTGDVLAGPGTGSQAATLAPTAVTAGSYILANITVDSKGRITSAANGSPGTTSPLTTKGDIYGFSTTNARLPVGADGYTLTADSTQALGVKWAPTAPGGVTSVSGTSPVVSSGGSTPAISMPPATTSANGYLTSTDWNTFNGKQAAGNYITSLTGEATGVGPGASAVTLSNSAVIAKVLTGYTAGAGTVAATDSLLSAIQKLDGNSQANASATAAKANSSRNINTTAPLTGGGDLSADRTLSIPKATGSVDGYLAATDYAAFNAKQAAGNYITATTGDVVATGPGSVAATIQPSSVTNAKMANMADSTFKGNIAGVAAAPQDLTGTQVTSRLSLFTPDTGSGGTKGLVTPPIAGDAAAGKFLGANGNWNGVNLGATSLSGTLAIANGGTGQATKQAAFNALSPAAAKGDQLIFDGTNNIALSACADGYQRVFDSTSSSGFKCQLGNISLATNWVAYTPTFTGIGTPTGVLFYWRRIGDTIEIQGSLTTGTGAATLFSLSLPNSLTIDTSKLSTTNMNIGDATRNANSTASPNVLLAYPSGSLNLVYSSSANSSSFTPLNPQNASSLYGSSELVSFKLKAPISQWSQTTTANIYDSGNYAQSTSTSVITATTTNPTKGTTSVDTISSGRNGKYMNLHWDYVQTAAGSAGSGIYLLALPGGLAADSTARANTTNGSAYCSGTVSNAANNVGSSTVQAVGYLYDPTHLALKILSYASSANGQNYATLGSGVFDFSGANTTISLDCANIPISTWSTFPVGVAVASQEVSAQATVSSSIAVTASSPILFTSTSFDNLGIYTPANGRWTIPANAPGRYEMSCNGFVGISATLFLLKNGTRVNAMFDSSTTARNAGMASAVAAGGDYFTVTPDASGTYAYSSGNYAPACTLKKIN